MATAGAKVTIACKLPIAWLDLQIYEKRTEMENTQTGPREIPVWRPADGKMVRIRGTSYPRGTPPEGFIDRPTIINGYALTPGVDKDFWEEWKAQNAKAPFVVNGAIVAHETMDGLKGSTKDREKELTGLEPVSRTGDSRMPAPSVKGVENLTDARPGLQAA